MKLSEKYTQRFGGVARLYGFEALQALSRSHFCVVGIGGVGTWVAEALVRTGVGEITLIDLDEVCVTNINRQLHALTSTIGRSKVQVMAARLREINPEVVVHKVEDFMDLDNIPQLLRNEHHIIVDAIDSAAVKAAMIAFCQGQKKSLITVGSAGGKCDPRCIGSEDLSRTEYDPLLAKTRQLLRQKYNFSRNPKCKFGVEAVYSREQMLYPTKDGGVCRSKAEAAGGDDKGGIKLDCSGGVGAVTMVTAGFGLVAAARGVDLFLTMKTDYRD